MTDIEKRAAKLLNDIECRKNNRLADEIFRESKQREAQKEAWKREETERLKQSKELWNPYLEKAMQRAEQEKVERDNLVNSLKKR